jgi:hypothetical protein
VDLKSAHVLCKRLRKLKINHREYEKVRDLAFSLAALAAEGSVIMIAGPTRVGKSQLGRELAEMLIKFEDVPHPRAIPLITVEATTAENGYFSTKHFTLRALREIRHPIFGSLGDVSNTTDYSPRMRDSEQAMRIALERGLEARSTRFLIVDEAHHLLRRKGKQRAPEILDSLKSLANTSKLVVILIGGYQLLTAGLSSAHINGRLKIVHFPRYQYSDADLPEFDKVLATISRLLPLPKGQSLLNIRDSIHKGTLGNIGQIFEWNEAAIAAMVAEKQSVLKHSHYQKTRFTNQLVEIEMDIQGGEAALEQVVVKDNLVIEKPKELQGLPTEKVRKRKRKPFARKLTRDVVAA